MTTTVDGNNNNNNNIYRHNNRHLPSTIRGIQNVSHVSCHLACAIQILVHTIPPIHTVLVDLLNVKSDEDVVDNTLTKSINAKDDDDDDDVDDDGTKTRRMDPITVPLMMELVNFLTASSLSTTTTTTAAAAAPSPATNEPWNPRKLYHYLHYLDPTINACEVGDSTTSLSKLLKILATVSHDWRQLLDCSIWEGTTRQILIGTTTRQEKRRNHSASTTLSSLPSTTTATTKPSKGNTCTIIRREKRQPKSKSMTCPFVIRKPKHSSLSPVLHTSSRTSSSSSSTTTIKKSSRIIRLEDCIHDMLKPTVVEGQYPWDNQVPDSYIETEEPCNAGEDEEDGRGDDGDDYDNYHDDKQRNDDDNNNGWRTTKKIELERIPRVWLLHLDDLHGLHPTERKRVSEQQQQQQHGSIHNNNDDGKDDNQTNNEDTSDFIHVDIPVRLDTNTLFKKKEKKSMTKNDAEEGHQRPSMILQGAIIQVQYIGDDDEDDTKNLPTNGCDIDDDEGHCFALIRSQVTDDGDGTGSNTTSVWSKLDDDKCHQIDEQEALQMMGGHVTEGVNNNNTSARSFHRASLLVYVDEDKIYCQDDWKSSMNSIIESWKMTLSGKQSLSKPTDPYDLIGRRLQVKWSKGKYYSGTITSFDPNSCKHQVTYDDGDIRTYNLDKKTIIWIDN